MRLDCVNVLSGEYDRFCESKLFGLLVINFDGVIETVTTVTQLTYINHHHRQQRRQQHKPIVNHHHRSVLEQRE